MPKMVSAQYLVKRIDGFRSYIAYILLLTIPSLVLSHEIFRQFSAELLTLIIGQKRYPLNILCNSGQVKINFCKPIAVGNIWLGIVIWRMSYSFRRVRADKVDPDQMPHFMASDLGLQRLPMTLLRVPGKNGLKLFSQYQQEVQLLYLTYLCCFGFNDPLRQYFNLYRAISQREGERKRELIVETQKSRRPLIRTY